MVWECEGRRGKEGNVVMEGRGDRGGGGRGGGGGGDGGDGGGGGGGRKGVWCECTSCGDE